MKHIIYFIRGVWLILSISILLLSTYRLSLLYSTRDISEMISVMSYGMMIISFPTGVVFFVILIFTGFLLNILNVHIENKFIMMVIIWFYLFLGGYVQWGILINKMMRR
ncbi:hypothetical protein FOB25_10570 [Citrobacter portucalensis]|nr:hypothetical protein FOB25_10570 [Citrobacter portucalensis]